MTHPSPPAPIALHASALVRPPDFSLSSNRYAAAGILAATVLARLCGHSWGGALRVGAAGALAWSTTRELDPDEPDTANAALPLASLAALVGGAPGLLAGLAVTSGLRGLAATVGVHPAPVDRLALAGQAALAGALGERAAALVPGAGLALSSSRPDGFGVPGREAGLIAAAALVPSLRPGQGRGGASDLLVLAALAVSGTLTAPEPVTSPTDLGNARVSAERVRLTRLLAVGTLGAGLLTRETRTLAPLAAGVLAVGLRRLLRRGA